MYYPMQTFLVAGLSRSGIAAARLLLARHAKAVYLYDDVEGHAVADAQRELTALGARVVGKEELPARIEGCDVLVLSPGIPIDHPLPVAFKKAGKAIVGEAELGARELTCPVVAVTGTNGKTTTVSLIGHVLRAAGLNAVVCGNVGTPVTACLEELAGGVAVAEISSFQLETLSSLRPHVAVVLNLSEDHLDRHYTMENYVYLKSRILKNCAESEYAVLNADDETVRAFAEKTRAKPVYFSLTQKTNGAYLEGDAVVWRGERVIPLSELPLSGRHNEADVLAAVCACKLMGAENEVIAQALQSFKGIPHRLQDIGEVEGVRFLDDSKATNVDAAVRAVESVKGESVVILGGKDKGEHYERLFAALKTSGVVHAVLCGENAFLLLDAAAREKFDRITLCRPFDLAVRVAFLLARRGQNVLLSPAAASYDAFKSYEERGERFRALMEELAKERRALACAQEEQGEGEGGD